VLIRAADVGRDDLEDDAVLDLLAGGIGKFGVVDVLDLDLAGAEIDETAIARPGFPPRMRWIKR
jgi:hypothetical protein